MARPSPVIVNSVYIDDKKWDLLEADTMYILTYKNKPISVRIENELEGNGRFKYKKSAYPNLGSIKRQVKQLNEQFDCEDFSYITIGN